MPTATRTLPIRASWIVPLDWMISKERAGEWRAIIDSGKPLSAPVVPTGAPDTTHVSVVDRWGNCVSLTHSLGSSSGVIPPGLGFMHNNSMLNFYPYAGHPNSIAPRKGRTTGMTPTIVLKERPTGACNRRAGGDAHHYRRRFGHLESD